MKRYKVVNGFAIAGGSVLSTVASVVGVGASIAGQFMQYNAQQQAAQNQAIRQQQAMQQRNQALKLEQEGTRRRQAEEQESLAREKFAANLESQKVKSRAEAAAASAGVTGASVDALMSEFDMRLGMFNEANLRQKQILDRSTDFDMKGMGQQYVADITRINQPISRPSAFGLALGVGSTLMNSKLFDTE